MIQDKNKDALTDEISEMVAGSYDLIGHDYHLTRRIHKFDSELQRFSDLLPEYAKILDAGSGSGVPASKYLSKLGHNVTGIDISEGMLESARKNVPQAKFIKMNMRDLSFKSESFDGVVSVFAIFHIPKQYHQDVLSEFHRVLKSGGILMFNQSVRAMDGISRFFGEPMMWSNYHPVETLEIVEDLGFEILFEGNLVRGGEIQYWVIARKP